MCIIWGLLPGDPEIQAPFIQCSHHLNMVASRVTELGKGELKSHVLALKCCVQK